MIENFHYPSYLLGIGVSFAITLLVFLIVMVIPFYLSRRD